MFCLPIMSGRRADVRRIVLRILRRYVYENIYARYMPEQLFISVSMNYALFTPTLVNNCLIFCSKKEFFPPNGVDWPQGALPP